MNVLQETGALKPETNELQPLGEVAAAARGANELWLAIVFTRGILNSLAPAQLAAAWGLSRSHNGMKSRSKEGPASVSKYLRLWTPEFLYLMWIASRYSLFA